MNFKKQAIAAGIAATIFASSANAQDYNPGYFSSVSNPVVPSEVTICNKTIDLDNVNFYERLDRELTSLTYTHGNTLLVIKRANRYFPQIAPILREQGMPEDLLYLACVESMLDPKAMSPAKAAGIWQFIPSTAKEYGLEVNDEVDERYNIEKATAAACRYFKNALMIFNGDWMSAMAAYNTGMARVSNQLNEQSQKSALDLHLSTETMRYNFRIMATKLIMENPAAFGFHISANQLYQPREVDIVEVSGNVKSWANWAIDHGTTYQALRDENPWICAPKLTNPNGKTYKVRVPKKTSLSRSAAGTKVYNSKWISE